jgi:CheY-like chemotaxis protein
MIEVGRVLDGVAEMLKRTLGERIRIETTVEANAWPIKVDPSQLEATLVNLAVNARDAMPDGGNLTIEGRNVTLDNDYADTHMEVKPGDYVVISVADTGSGMTPEVLSRVFEPFFTTKEVGRGTGLGLSMVHGFVRQSGGHVAIYSEVGHGTVVRIYLPRAEATAPAALGLDTESERQSQARNILVVEDNEALRSVVVRMLASLGHRTIEATDAPSALEVLSAKSAIDLLFTDVVLPGPLDGIGLAKQARLERPGLKVLLTSGFTERTAARGNGRTDSREPLPPLLGKPYRKADLAKAVLSALSDGNG